MPRCFYQAFLTFVTLFAASAACGATSATASLRKPNIILIMADDLGQEALECYGNDVNRTPNLNRLAQQGMKFNHAHSTPLCTPSRVQLMTGKYNHRNYVSFGVMEPTEKTFAHYLRDAGYATGIAGKWQLLGDEKQQAQAGNRTGLLPEQAGFDQYCLWQIQEKGPRYKHPTITSSTSGTQTYEGHYGPDLFSDFALAFMREHRHRPFFFYYPMVLTHAPFQPTPDSPAADYQAVREKGTKAKFFRDQVVYMDKVVGKVVDGVASLGLAEQTLILFTGDNGTGRPITSSVKGRKIQGAKGETTKYGTNVPLIAWWPRTIPPSQINDNLVDFTDFLPTLLEAASQAPPPPGELDGISFLKQLQGVKAQVRDWVFCYYRPQMNKDKKFVWAHDKTWKLYSDGRFYNMDTDPLEQSPIAEASLSPDALQARKQLQQVIDTQLAKAPRTLKPLPVDPEE